VASSARQVAKLAACTLNHCVVQAVVSDAAEALEQLHAIVFDVVVRLNHGILIIFALVVLDGGLVFLVDARELPDQPDECKLQADRPGNYAPILEERKEYFDHLRTLVIAGVDPEHNARLVDELIDYSAKVKEVGCKNKHHRFVSFDVAVLAK
jgi:hypothetical protein